MPGGQGRLFRRSPPDTEFERIVHRAKLTLLNMARDLASGHSESRLGIVTESGVRSGCFGELSDVPREQFFDPVDRMFGD
ncbi:hypothetical protein BQ8482_460005 [Mesorhizobium delmotii]|uniref:Uncharacterized protein n=1 Tax=Mesorhizobium delmotii TaxID=1631247 RepID=A0A2P9ATJ3_9HYPH|nr:hypothetical protein BQ8482_460005 [Mesorhizobium delmotii]